MRAFAALAFLCIASLAVNGFMAWRLSSASDEIEQLELTVTNLRAARHADGLAQSLRDKLYRETHENAQTKYDAINAVSDALPDDAWLDALRRGLRPTGGDNNPDAAGKSDAANAAPGTAGGADAHR